MTKGLEEVYNRLTVFEEMRYPFNPGGDVEGGKQGLPGDLVVAEVRRGNSRSRRTRVFGTITLFGKEVGAWKKKELSRINGMNGKERRQ